MKPALYLIFFIAIAQAIFPHEVPGHVAQTKAKDIVLTAPDTWKGYAVKRDLVPAGKFGRKLMTPMSPRYVTVHSTQNFSSGADALAHAKGQRQGNFKSTYNKLGYLAWHFTVDDSHIIQSLPCNERGQHADYEGMGNEVSIGIEMCEHPKNDRAKTLDHTARLCALLMAEYQIPLQHIVPHQHWERVRYTDQKNIGHKNCPHFLLENGKPGKKWQAFLATVHKYYKTHPKYDAELVKHPASEMPVGNPQKPSPAPKQNEEEIDLPTRWEPGEKPGQENEPK